MSRGLPTKPATERRRGVEEGGERGAEDQSGHFGGGRTPRGTRPDIAEGEARAREGCSPAAGHLLPTTSIERLLTQLRDRGRTASARRSTSPRIVQ